jgi:hypothetical protein
VKRGRIKPFELSCCRNGEAVIERESMAESGWLISRVASIVEFCRIGALEVDLDSLGQSQYVDLVEEEESLIDIFCISKRFV